MITANSHQDAVVAAAATTADDDTTSNNSCDPGLQASTDDMMITDSNQQQQQQQQHVSTIDPELLPVNWPKNIKYLVDYEYHPSIPRSLLDLVQGRRRRRRRKAKEAKSPRSGGDPQVEHKNEEEGEEEEEEEEKEEPRSELEVQYDDIPIGHAIPGFLKVSPSQVRSSIPPSTIKDSLKDPILTSFPCSPSSSPPLSSSSPLDPPYQVRLITSPPTHPVLGSYGLFATRTLRPGLHLLDYISDVVPDQYANPESDHTLYLCHDLNLDATTLGNHGRFVNDFRGIRSYQQGPNVGWDLYRDQETGQVRMGCKVLKRIQKDQEILCTYGKDYWKNRGVKVIGNEWEDGWDTDLEDFDD